MMQGLLDCIDKIIKTAPEILRSTKAATYNHLYGFFVLRRLRPLLPPRLTPLLSPLLLFLQPEGEGTQGRGQRSPAGNNKILRGPKFRADACGQVLDPSRVSPGKVVPDQTAEGITEQKCKTRVVNMELEVGIGQFEEQIGCLRERGREGGQPEGEGGGGG